MSRLGRVPPSFGRDVIDRKACFLSLLAQAAVWLLELRVSRTFLWQLRSQLFRPWIPNSRRHQHFRSSLGAFCLFELRVFSTFLYILRLICSGHGYPAQRAANTSCPCPDRFWLLELRVSQQISTFYEPPVQDMDAQLGARHRRRPPTIHRGSAQRVGREACGVGRENSGQWPVKPTGGR